MYTVPSDPTAAELWISGRESPGSTVSTPGFVVSNVRSKTACFGPANGLLPVCCGSIWYIDRAATELSAAGVSAVDRDDRVTTMVSAAD
jgi:hypothetical protein